MRFLVDENLSPTLARVCQEAGYEATSVRDRGMLNATDRELSRFCFDEDWVLVTNNAVDFLDLAVEARLHPGLVFLPLGSGAEMRAWMASAIAELERLAEVEGADLASLMVNSVLEVEEDGRCDQFEYPPPAAQKAPDPPRS